MCLFSHISEIIVCLERLALVLYPGVSPLKRNGKGRHQFTLWVYSIFVKWVKKKWILHWKKIVILAILTIRLKAGGTHSLRVSYLFCLLGCWIVWLNAFFVWGWWRFFWHLPFPLTLLKLLLILFVYSIYILPFSHHHTQSGMCWVPRWSPSHPSAGQTQTCLASAGCLLHVPPNCVNKRASSVATSSVLHIDLPPIANGFCFLIAACLLSGFVSHHRLLQLCQRTMALPLGRGMFTLFSYHPVPTEPLPIPKLNLTGLFYNIINIK